MNRTGIRRANLKKRGYADFLSGKPIDSFQAKSETDRESYENGWASAKRDWPNSTDIPSKEQP